MQQTYTKSYYNHSEYQPANYTTTTTTVVKNEQPQQIYNNEPIVAERVVRSHHVQEQVIRNEPIVEKIQTTTVLQSNNNRSVQDLLDEGINLYDRGNYTLAMDKFQQCLAIDNKNENALINLGHVYRKMGKPRDAILEYERCLRINEASDMAQMDIGVAHLNMGENREAINAFRKSIVINPNYYTAYMNLGVALDMEKEYEESIKCFERCIQINPVYISAYLQLDSAYLRRNSFEELVELYNQIAERNPEQAHGVYNHLGNLFKARESYINSFENYEKAHELKSEIPDYSINKSIINTINKRYNVANSELVYASNYNNTYPNNTELGLLLQNSNRNSQNLDMWINNGIPETEEELKPALVEALDQNFARRNEIYRYSLQHPSERQKMIQELKAYQNDYELVLIDRVPQQYRIEVQQEQQEEQIKRGGRRIIHQQENDNGDDLLENLKQTDYEKYQYFCAFVCVMNSYMKSQGIFQYNKDKMRFSDSLSKFLTVYKHDLPVDGYIMDLVDEFVCLNLGEFKGQKQDLIQNYLKHFDMYEENLVGETTQGSWQIAQEQQLEFDEEDIKYFGQESKEDKEFYKRMDEAKGYQHYVENSDDETKKQQVDIFYSRTGKRGVLDATIMVTYLLRCQKDVMKELEGQKDIQPKLLADVMAEFMRDNEAKNNFKVLLGMKQDDKSCQCVIF